MARRLIPLLLLLFVAGCSEPPQKEIDQAQSAIDAAKAAGADVYVPDEYDGAVSTLQKSRQSVDQRDYRQALSYAIDARQRAIGASKQAPDARARARKAAETLIKDNTARADHLQVLVQNAAEARVPLKELRAPRATLALARTALQEARTALDAGNFRDSSAALSGVREKLDIATKEVESIPPRAAKARAQKGKR